MLRRLILLLALPVVLALAACGSSGSGSGADPASVAPSGAPVYLEVTLRPQGGTREDALAAAGKLLRTDDPEKRIPELIQQAINSDGGKGDYAKDIEPWLGDRAGLFVMAPSSAAADPGFGVAIAVRDEDEARSSIERLYKGNGEKLSQRKAGGDTYELSSSGSAFIVKDDFAIIGTEDGLKRALQAQDGKSLADDDRYEKAIDPLTDDRLAHYYIDIRTLVDAAMKLDPDAASQLGPFRSLFTSSFGEPQAGSFSADGDRLVIEAFSSAKGNLAQKLTSLTSATAPALLKELPGDAWGALGVPNVGESARSLFQQFAGAFGGAAISGQLKSQYGIDLDQDVFSWMGDVGVFVRGTQLNAIDGGLVIQATDESKAAGSFGKLVGLLRTRGGVDPQPAKVDGADAAFAVKRPGAPKPIVLARGNGRVVVAYGADAAAQGISADSKLSESDTYGEAKDALADDVDPALFVSVPAILALVEASGSGSDPDYQKAKPYLQALGVVASGAKKEGDRVRSRFAVGLR